MNAGPLLKRKTARECVYINVCVFLKNIQKGLKTFLKGVLLKNCALKRSSVYVSKSVDLKLTGTTRTSRIKF